MKNSEKYQEKIKATTSKYISLLTKHRLILLFAILGTAVAFALLKTQSFIDIPRNEQRYNEETLKIKYKQIDKDTLESFATEKNDTDVQVNSKFDPTRNNPFVD